MYPYREGIKHTIISFEPLFQIPAFHGMTDAQIGKKLGIATQTVRAMRYNQEVPFDTIRAVCHALDCQPGDIMKAIFTGACALPRACRHREKAACFPL